MQNNEDKKRMLVNRNINHINDYLVNMADDEIDNLYQRMEDVLFFYGFNKEAVRKIVESRGLRSTASMNKLAELEGVTNAMLFHLKYKMEAVPSKKKIMHDT